MKRTLIYTAKVFATTALLGPAVLVAILAAYKPSTFNGGDAIYTLLAIPVGLVLCLPSWLLLWWLTTYLTRSLGSNINIKVWLSLACLPLSILPFAIMDYRTITYSNYWPDLAPWVFTYAGITIVGIWLYKLQPLTNKPPITQS